jgi:hypothetical protein
MDITPTSASTMGPPTLNCPPTDRNGASPFQSQSQSQSQANGDAGNTSPNGSSAPAVGAAAAAQQPKVVQTAFIHKLYKCVCPTTMRRIRLLIRVQHARGPEHPTSHFLGEHQRELRHVALERVLQSLVVRTSGALGPCNLSQSNRP